MSDTMEPEKPAGYPWPKITAANKLRVEAIKKITHGETLRGRDLVRGDTIAQKLKSAEFSTTSQQMAHIPITPESSKQAAEFITIGETVNCPRFGNLTVESINVDADTNLTMVGCTYGGKRVRIEACLFCNGYLGGNFCPLA